MADEGQCENIRTGIDWRRTVALILLSMVLATYLGSYFILSRSGYAEAKRYDSDGFYYFTPQDSDAWRFWNETCIVIFWPLNAIDRALGLGKSPAYEPLWDLSLKTLGQDWNC